MTLFGWALYFSGLLLLFASPERLIAMVEGMKLERNLPVYALVTGLVGLYFLGAGDVYKRQTLGAAVWRRAR